MFCTLPVGDSGLGTLGESVSFVPDRSVPYRTFALLLSVVVLTRMVSALATDMYRPAR